MRPRTPYSADRSARRLEVSCGSKQFANTFISVQVDNFRLEQARQPPRTLERILAGVLPRDMPGGRLPLEI